MFWKEDSGRQVRLITPEDEGGDETSSPSPPRFTFFDDPDVPLNLSDTPPAPPGPPPGLLPAPPPAGGRGRARAEHVSRERSRPRSQSPEPLSDNDYDQSPQDGRQRSRSRDRVHPSAQAPQTPPIQVPQTPPVPPIQPMVIREPFTVPDEDSGNSGRRQRSRSRERAPVHVPIYTDDESATVEPQGRMSDRSNSPQGKESPQRQKGKKNSAEAKKPRDLPKAKKHEPMDSDEDDEVPQN